MGRIGLSPMRLLRGWGRRAAWLVVVPLLVLQGGCAPLFDTPRLALFDLYERTFPRQWTPSPALHHTLPSSSHLNPSACPGETL